MTLTDIEGLLVGHAQDQEHHTGCTAVLCPQGAVGGINVAGFAPGSRETELLRPETRVEEIHGLLLTGGSAFGLAAATGVVRWLTEQGVGLDTFFGRVPLVPGAVVFDLFFNQSFSKPDEAMGYEAARSASSAPVVQGCVGAGTGVTCGKLGGFERVMKSGLGSAGDAIGDFQVAALAVVNPLGDVHDPDTGRLLAGMRTQDGQSLAGPDGAREAQMAFLKPASTSNTVLGVVATNAPLTKVQACRLARMASAGIARAVRPAHLLYDGDVVFALATGRGPETDENVIGALGAEVLARAIAAGVKSAEGLPGVPAMKDLGSA